MYFKDFIGEQNRGTDEKSQKRLSDFVLINPYKTDYPAKLEQLLLDMDEQDALADNVLLARAMLVAEPLLRIENLSELAKKFADRDGGIKAKFEIASIYVSIYKEHGKLGAKTKTAYLEKAREHLKEFIADYPESIFTAEAKEKLAGLPKSE